MNLRPKEYAVNPDNLYESKLLDRKDYVENIIKLLSKNDESLILALSGRFGIGKTTMLRIIDSRAQQSGFKTVFINAWESDYIEDPFSVIISELNQLFPKNTELKERLKESSLNLIKTAVPALIKATTYGLLDLKQPIEETIATISSQFAKEEFDRHLRLKKNINSFKESLADVAHEQYKTSERILIFIDELDRCRPTYAIRMLESIKHMFDVPFVSFIIGMDISQIKISIEHIYGSGINADGYLRRFFDIQLDVPEPSQLGYIDYLCNLHDINSVIEKRKQKSPENDYDRHQFCFVIEAMSKIYNASLRDIEKIVNRYVLVLMVTNENQLLFPGLLAFLITIRMFDYEIYEKILDKQIQIDEIIQYFLETDSGRDFLFNPNPSYGMHLIAELCFAVFDKNKDSSPYKYFDNVINHPEGDAKFKDFITSIKRIAQEYRRGDDFGNIMKYLIKKLDFIEEIKG